MCLGPCLFLFEFLPYIFLVSLPVYGAFCGIDVILRLSLLLYVHSVIIECIPRFLFYIVPYLQLGLFIGLSFLPINLTPTPLVWIYDKLLWMTEPILLLAEVVLVQNIVMRCSQRATEKIEDDIFHDSGFKWKCLIIGFSSICYACCFWLLWNIYQQGSTVQLWLVVVVLLLLVAIHNMMWMSSEEGILSDVAFCSLCSILAMYAMLDETAQIRAPMIVPASWNTSYAKSLLDIFLYIMNMQAENAVKAVLLIKKFLCPLFLITVIVRLYSILFIVNKITKNFSEGLSNVTLIDDTEDEESTISLMAPWKSPIILRLSVIFMFTQLTTVFLSECSGGFLAQFHWLLGTDSIWPSQILVGRLFQVLAVNCFYMWRLYRADDWTWSEWLTPD